MFANFFSLVQESGWYKDFLLPVVDLIPAGAAVLDIGTGTGKMIEFIVGQNNPTSPQKIAGTDTSEKMLAIAEEKLATEIKSGHVSLHKTSAGEEMPFEKEQFDVVAICNVLFNLSNEARKQMLDDARRVLKSDGKIVVLTPTGIGGFGKITRLYKPFFNLKNITMYIWYFATGSRARPWTEEKYLANYAQKEGLNYQHKLIMHDFAQIEIISSN